MMSLQSPMICDAVVMEVDLCLVAGAWQACENGGAGKKTDKRWYYRSPSDLMITERLSSWCPSAIQLCEIFLSTVGAFYVRLQLTRGRQPSRAGRGNAGFFQISSHDDSRLC
jgi:hypothetical protein